MGEFRARMFAEYSELQTRIDKLKKFIISDIYEDLEDIDRKDLKEQLKYMELYCKVLSRRVSRQCNSA